VIRFNFLSFARYDVGDDLQRARRVAVDLLEADREVDERGSTDAHQHVGPQARRALPILSLKADEPAEHERCRLTRVSSSEAKFISCVASMH
jgi:hypothetical protein